MNIQIEALNKEITDLKSKQNFEQIGDKSSFEAIQ